jgi:hypothetical protein
MPFTASSIRSHGLISWRIGVNADQSQQEGQSQFSSRSIVREPIHLVPAWGNKEALSLSERADGALLPASTETQYVEMKLRVKEIGHEQNALAHAARVADLAD